jgi:hypothetical protein
MNRVLLAAKLGGVMCTIALCALLALASASTAFAVENEEMGHFRTRVSPHVAGVFINGKYYGTAAMFAPQDRAIALKPGVYDVELQDPRYKTLRAKVTVEAGKTSTLRRAMEHLSFDVKGPFGELRTTNFPNAAIYLNGKYYANTDEMQMLFGRSLLLKPGKYHLKIEPADGTVGRQAEIEIKADMTLIVGREKMSSFEYEE